MKCKSIKPQSLFSPMLILSVFISFTIVNNSSFAKNQLSQQQENEFTSLVLQNTVFQAKDLQLLFKDLSEQPLTKETEINEMQRSCMQDLLSDERFKKFNQKRIKSWQIGTKSVSKLKKIRVVDATLTKDLIL